MMSFHSNPALAVVFWLLASGQASLVPCTETTRCEEVLSPGSMCVNGLCTNAFYDGGCLKSVLPNWNRTRICNSQDPPEAEALGFCHPSPMDKVEVRIAGHNWESENFLAWILQIVLSELLDVPTSIESGTPEVPLNFYDKHSGFEYWNTAISYDLVEQERAASVGDCQKITSSPDNYQSCFHVHPEIWESDYPSVPSYKYVEPWNELGVMAELATWIPLFAVKQDPTLLSYVGLQGEENRRKVAETFKRPTRWGHYCQEVSLTNCTKPDMLAHRAPQNEEEEKSFFVDGVYFGHFRYTEENDCDLHPTTCTGHYTNYPCGWTSFAQQQAYHMDIAFAYEGPEANGGYPSSETVQIWLAANTTKSPVAIYWWTPNPMLESFIGTAAEFVRVSFPTPTQECADNRVDFRAQCDLNSTLGEKMGLPVGACDTYPQSLKVTMSTGLRDISEDPSLPIEFWSPAYAVVNSFFVNNLQLDQIFRYRKERGTDPLNFDPRAAVCQWVSENLELAQSWIPESHPRVVEDIDSSGEPLFVLAFGLAVFAGALVTASMAFGFIRRKTKVVYYAQSEFLFMIHFGMLLTVAGAISYVANPATVACGLTYWLVNLGYVFQLVPMLMRISAIHHLVAAGKQMERAQLKIWKLYITVAVAVMMISSFLLVWTLIDPPQERFQFEVSDRKTLQGETIVNSYNYCGSDSDLWYVIQFTWRALILIPACLVGFLALQIREDLNDTKSLSFVLFLRLFFQIVMAAVGLASQNAKAASDVMGYWSILLSTDTIISILVYIFPKFLASSKDFESDPLPDVFVHTTVCLVDLVGFTAWSSVREPVAVFQFLEQLYQNFDKLAEARGVYKVETVRESYVAATGIPSAQPDHAVLMAQFASSCMKKLPKYLRQLEVQFGPDTSDLSLRIGMHSGPVTGGFLKGKGSRFQLFGDTMTTATLIQSFSASGGVHLSEATACLLVKAGRKRWVLERDDEIVTLEKGKLRTFWLVQGGVPGSCEFQDITKSPGVSEDSDSEGDHHDLGSQHRWIEWNVAVLNGILKQIVARHAISSKFPTFPLDSNMDVTATMPLEEVKEMIVLPKFDRKAARRQHENSDAIVPEKVVQELRGYVTEISDLYNNENPFHNFAHASYVVMAVIKYMNRIIAATEVNVGDDPKRFRCSVQATLHDHTYGITSDPLTQFACAFSALIHDVDHPGVPNQQLIKENKSVGLKYKNRSVAEQKSVDIALDLLSRGRFATLRGCLCRNSEEMRRFRALVINSVMATDLGDREMKELRNNRWEKAFSKNIDGSVTDSSSHPQSLSLSLEAAVNRNNKSDTINRKATIVIEHLIQAADVAHMSQHWAIYRKWNERLFRETYKAYREGRTETNPVDGWYKGEIGFFDFYIIPLCKKLRDCGVFGPTSDENLNYASNNRKLWFQEGEAIVKDMLSRVEAEYHVQSVAPPRRAIESQVAAGVPIEV